MYYVQETEECWGIWYFWSASECSMLRLCGSFATLLHERRRYWRWRSKRRFGILIENCDHISPSSQPRSATATAQHCGIILISVIKDHAVIYARTFVSLSWTISRSLLRYFWYLNDIFIEKLLLLYEEIQ